MLTNGAKGVDRYVLVIDTDQYAGNFERELCAYVTGYVGDCGVGAKYVNKFAKDVGIELGNVDAIDIFYNTNYQQADIVEYVADEHGCYRPVALWEPTTAVCIFLQEEPSLKLACFWVARIVEFFKSSTLSSPAKLLHVQLEHQVTTSSVVETYSILPLTTEDKETLAKTSEILSNLPNA